MVAIIIDHIGHIQLTQMGYSNIFIAGAGNLIRMPVAVECIFELADNEVYVGVKRVLKTKTFDINEKDSNGKNYFHYAAFSDDAALMEILVSQPKICLNFQSYTLKMAPLMIATKNGSASVVRVLLKAGANASLLEKIFSNS